MTEITNYTSGVSSGSSSSSTSSATAALTSDFETFLTLMTTQAQYQDPLDPMDSSDYTAQLAQFSSVEQQVLTNETLSTITEQLNLSNMTQLTGWVGQEVRAQAAAVFDGETPVTVLPNPAAISDRVDLVVYDESGSEVDRVSMPVSAEPFEWTGDKDDGSKAEAGNYTFVVESYSDDEVILSEVGEVYNRVTETQAVDGEVALILESGTAILATTVTALRETTSEEETVADTETTETTS